MANESEERARAFLNDMTEALHPDEARGAALAVLLIFLADMGHSDVVDAFVGARRRCKF